MYTVKSRDVVNNYDSILIVSSLVLVLIFLVLLLLPSSSLLQSVGDYMIMLTHFLLFPLFIWQLEHRG